MVLLSLPRTSLVVIIALGAQVHCGHVFFPTSNEAVDTHQAQTTQEHLNVHPGISEPRVLFAQNTQDDTISSTQNDAIEQESLEESPEARGLWESDLFFLQKLSGLFGGNDTPKRKRIRPQNIRPELLPPSLANRRNGLQHPRQPIQNAGQNHLMRHPAALANTLTAPRPHWDAQQGESNRIAVKVPPQPRPVRPEETIQNVAPAESFPYQFVRPDQPEGFTDKRKPIKQQPNASVIKRQPVLIRNKFPGKAPKPVLLNGPDPSRKTVVVQSQAPNSFLQLGSSNASKYNSATSSTSGRYFKYNSATPSTSGRYSTNYYWSTSTNKL
ncbi:unnamed protein product [Meganyctiphanes norvegica]|uniref:Uncharacterized protein n=1 Tax=Meganyctiphanes norvegica TaxID=48144 RepID=A0AAV2QSJ6_MEGNR